MATVIEILELSEGVSGGADLESGGQHVRAFLVTFDGINKYAPSAIIATDGINTIPLYYTVHPADTSSRLMAITSEPVDGANGLIWKTTCTYRRPTINANAPTSPSSPSGGGGAPASITPQKIEIGFWTKTAVVWQDTAGTALRNSAGDMYDQQPTREDEHIQFTITRTQSSVNLDWLEELNNHYNSSAFTISGRSFPAYTLKCNITASYPVGSDNTLWEVKIVLKYDPDTWDWIILNAGYYEKDSGTGALKKITSSLDGKFATKPMLLDAAGAKLAPGGTPTYKTYFKYYGADFAYLGLGY